MSVTHSVPSAAHATCRGSPHDPAGNLHHRFPIARPGTSTESPVTVSRTSGRRRTTTLPQRSAVSVPLPQLRPTTSPQVTNPPAFNSVRGQTALAGPPEVFIVRSQHGSKRGDLGLRTDHRPGHRRRPPPRSDGGAAASETDRLRRPPRIVLWSSGRTWCCRAACTRRSRRAGHSIPAASCVPAIKHVACISDRNSSLESWCVQYTKVRTYVRVGPPTAQVFVDHPRHVKSQC
jgi:hypothetical protein